MIDVVLRSAVMPGNYELVANYLLTGAEENAVTILNACQRNNDDKRYRPQQNNRDQIIRSLFTSAWKSRECQAVCKREVDLKQSYLGKCSSLINRVIWIQLPGAISAFLSNKIVKVVFAVAVIGLTIFYGYKAYDICLDIFFDLLPWIHAHTPTFLAHLGDWLATITWGDLFVWCVEISIVQWILHAILPEIPYLSALLNATSPILIFLAIFGSYEGLLSFLFGTALGVWEFAASARDSISYFFAEIARNAKAVEEQFYRERAFALWKHSVSQLLPVDQRV